MVSGLKSCVRIPPGSAINIRIPKGANSPDKASERPADVSWGTEKGGCGRTFQREFRRGVHARDGMGGPELGAGDVDDGAGFSGAHGGYDGFDCPDDAEEICQHLGMRAFETVGSACILEMDGTQMGFTCLPELFDDSAISITSVVYEHVDASILIDAVGESSLKVRAGDVQNDPAAAQLLDLGHCVGRLGGVAR